jgi:hypothetical protein
MDVEKVLTAADVAAQFIQISDAEYSKLFRGETQITKDLSKESQRIDMCNVDDDVLYSMYLEKDVDAGGYILGCNYQLGPSKQTIIQALNLKRGTKMGGIKKKKKGFRGAPSIPNAIYLRFKVLN